MKNVELFNEFVLRVLDHLYDAFPVPCVIDPEEFVAKLEISSYPPNPVSSYCGPDMSWAFSSESHSQFWTAHPWDETVTQVESLLGRSLTDPERSELQSSGHRPLSTEEQQAVLEWETEKRKIDDLRSTEKTQREEAENKRKIFIATLQFLANEKLIRFTDLPPPKEGQVLNPPDILIARATKSLRFVLTSNGFTHLNSTFEGGKITGEMTLYQAIKRTLKEKSVEGASAVGIQTLVAWLLS